MGRAVRGEKDYCVVVLIGPDLIRALQAPGQREYFSCQTRTQIDLGKELAGFAREELGSSVEPIVAVRRLIEQCLKRDKDWKDWYVERMNEEVTVHQRPREDLLNIFQSEMKAESEFENGNYDKAVETIQSLIDHNKFEDPEKGWYLQEMARYHYLSSKTRSNELQVDAHRKNRSLLRPKAGMAITRVKALTSEKRIERIREWLVREGTFQNVSIKLESILANLTFGVLADRFEAAMKDLATALGLDSDRPDKEWKEGPDNLWGLRDNQYLLIECKNEVELDRKFINKRESDQMNRSSAWFNRHYSGSKVTRVMIIPTRKVGSDAAFNDEVQIIDKSHLLKLVRAVRNFFNEFRSSDFGNLSDNKIQDCLRVHELNFEDLTSNYSQKPIAHSGKLGN